MHGQRPAEAAYTALRGEQPLRCRVWGVTRGPGEERAAPSGAALCVVEEARLGVDETNVTNAMKLSEGLGFTVARRRLVWHRNLGEGATPKS